MNCRYCDQGFGLHTCDCPVADRPTPPVPNRENQRGYVPPSRAGRVPRSEYLASIYSSPENKRAIARSMNPGYSPASAS